MCETREHFCQRLLDLSKLEVLFKCNDLHLFPVSFFILFFSVTQTAPPYLLTGGRSFNAVSPVSASTGVLATAADPCSNFTADNAGAKSMGQMLTLASPPPILLECQMLPTASLIA